MGKKAKLRRKAKRINAQLKAQAQSYVRYTADVTGKNTLKGLDKAKRADLWSRQHCTYVASMDLGNASSFFVTRRVANLLTKKDKRKEKYEHFII